MKRLCTALALAMLAGCTPALAQDLNVRQFDRTVDPRNVTTTDRLTWYAGESIEYIVRSRRGREVVDVPPGSVPVWRMQQGTNDYLVVSGEVVTNGTVRFRVYSPDSNFAPGLYTSWAEVFQGTNLVGVLDRTSVEVKWRPGDDYAIVPPITNLFDQVLAAWNTACSAGVAAVAADLSAHAADTDNPHGVTAESLGALTEEEDAAALAAVAGVQSNLTDLAETVGGITAESLGALTEETDPAWSAWEPEAHVPIVCSGGYYFPDYFTLDPKPTAVSFASYGSTQEYNSVVFQWRTFSAESGFVLSPDIIRQEDWDEEVAYSGLVNLAITPNGELAVASWLPGATTGTVGSFVATLGDFSRLVEVTYTASESTPSSNAYWLADLPGSLRENINSNTLAAASASGVESNLYNTDAYATTNFVRNAACWAADFDLTCASPWNSYSGRYRAGTLVTSQHVAYAAHYTAPTGTVFRFVDATNGVHDRTLVDQRLLAYDIAIGLLDEPLGAEITPAKVLGMDQIGYLRGRYGLRDAPGLRLVCLDKCESAWLAGSSLMETVSGHRWESPYAYFSGSTNLPYSRERAGGGDSGNPIFMIVGGETTLLSTFYSPTSGPFLPYSRTAIEAAIADMGGSVHTNLTAPDLSAWENFDAGQDLPDF